MTKRGRPPKLMDRKKMSACLPDDVLQQLHQRYAEGKINDESFSEWFERRTLNSLELKVMYLPKKTQGWVHPSFFLTDGFWEKMESFIKTGYSKRSVILSVSYAIIA